MAAFVIYVVVLYWTSHAMGITLDYSSKDYTTIPHNTSIAAAVVDFSLKSNQLTRINDAEFSMYEQLQKLDLSRNSLKYISDTAFRKTKITELNLELNALSVLPTFAGIKGKLSQLKVSNNNIKDLSTVGDLTALSHFYAYGNELDSIADIPKNELTLLYIGANAGLTEISGFEEALKIINQYPLLSQLSLRSLELTTFPDLSGVSDTLTTLDLYGNNIPHIPETSLNVLEKLSHLDMHKNGLQALPSFSGVASTLQRLYLGSNQLTSTTLGSLSELVNLRHLDLKDNPIADWTDFTSVASQAPDNERTLELDSNPSLPMIYTPTYCHFHTVSMKECGFTQYPNLESCWRNSNTKLKKLVLAGNSITEFPYRILAKVAVLELSGNKISKLDPWKMNQALCENSGLTKLDLSDNDFASIAERPDLCHHGQSTELILKGMSCGCKMLWLRKALLCVGDSTTAKTVPCYAPTDESCNIVKRICDGSGATKSALDCKSKLRLSFITDYNITSCYDVTNNAETIELDLSDLIALSTGYSGISEVTVTTFGMDCRSEFHVLVYQQPTSCGTRARCVRSNHKEPLAGYHQCRFRCDCQTDKCGDKSSAFVRVAHPRTGSLCEISTRVLGV